MSTLTELYKQLERDKWREQVPFSAEITAAHRSILREGATDEELSNSLCEWLQRYQPCLFGRIAAKLNLLTFCFLRESDIAESETHVREKIQQARSAWTREAYEGRKSGFVILVISERLALSEPSVALKEFAQRLCSLYLLCPVEPGQIYTDEIFLERPGPTRVTWKWNVGVNYFAANADGRWWRDHRIPGGVGFSMNSVGHMVKSGLIAAQLSHLSGLVGGPDEELVTTKVDSLPKALEMAMRTIWLAADTPSGKATELLPLENKDLLRQCPVKLPDFLQDRDFRNYRGYYHTDVTVPSEYFLPDIVRPSGIVPKSLDFTYLFDASIGNFDFVTTGEGRRIRSLDDRGTEVPSDKRAKSVAQTVEVQNVMRRIGEGNNV